MAASTINLPDARPADAKSTIERPWRPRVNPWIVAMTVTLATFMEVLDSSIANVALPHIAGGLGATQDEATWVLTAYLVANAIILPAGAYMTTFIGRKQFYMICVALFGISSALCGLAPSLPILIFCRVLQGVGGGGLAPSEQAILADTFPPAKRGQAFAMYGLAVVCAPAIGPTLGGYITDNFDWRWIFFINVPICLISLFLTSRIVEDPPYVKEQVAKSKKGGIKLDFLGFGLLGLTFGSLEFVLDKGQEDDWFSSHLITFFTVAAVVAFIAMIWWEIKQLREGHRPILNLTLFQRRNFAISFVLMFVLGFSLYGTTILIPQLVQTLLGFGRAGGPCSLAGGTDDDVHDAGGRLSRGQGRSAQTDWLWVCQSYSGAGDHAYDGPQRELWPPCLSALLSGFGLGFPFYSYQHHCLHRG
jgi:DHA2 family multidrug resistance protein